MRDTYNPTSSLEIYSAVVMKNDTKSKLLEPLLKIDITTKPDKESSSNLEDGNALLTRLKIVSFVVGSLAAVFSQWILSQTLWYDGILEKNTWEVVQFSFVWSCCTCFFIFTTMMCFILTADKMFSLSNRTIGHLKWDDVMFLIEAHHIVGSLISISLSWFFVDAFRFGMPATQVHNVLLLVLTAVWYAVCIFVFSKKQQEDDEENDQMDDSGRNSANANSKVLLPTYKLIASTLGLIVGLCSQFVLSIVLFKEHMTKPIFDNAIIFCSLWSLCTVVITFLGCITLRCSTYQENVDHVQNERAFLRMESYYIFSSLCGICLAWILVDLIMGMTDQVLPSLVMLTVSLMAFRAILVCFPERKILEEFQELNKEAIENSKSNENDKQILIV